VRFALDPIEINVGDHAANEEIDYLMYFFNTRMDDGKTVIKFENVHIRMTISHKCNNRSIGFAEFLGVELF
jgi:hypothetical protein